MRKSAWLVIPAGALALGACADTGYNDRAGYSSRDGYREARRHRQLGDNDRIYRDREGRYYCKRSDGTTGTIVGAIAGGVLGNIIAPGGSKRLGTILGGAGGAIAGRAIDRNNIRCE